MSEKIVRVRDIMRPRFIVVDGMETVADALRKMAAEPADVLIVDKRHENDEYGIVLLTNIVAEVLAVNRAARRINVYEIMSKPVIMIDAKMNIRYCAQLFANFSISTAPVTEDGKIVGIVSYRELAFGGIAKGLASDEIDSD